MMRKREKKMVDVLERFIFRITDFLITIAIIKIILKILKNSLSKAKVFLLNGLSRLIKTL